MRTQKEIISLANTVKNEADNLPEESNFDESNEEEIELCFEMARQLYAAAGGHTDEVTNVEVINWLDGKSSELNVYN
tara:strand:+ start:246 stop:476 length:231 start_codon:yes stop_codon:yes gene_type:complete